METPSVEAREQPPRGVVPGTCVRLSSVPARVGAPEEAPAEPTLEVVRVGDVVRALDVTCPCGRHVRVHCLYE